MKYHVYSSFGKVSKLNETFDSLDDATKHLYDMLNAFPMIVEKIKNKHGGTDEDWLWIPISDEDLVRDDEMLPYGGVIEEWATANGKMKTFIVKDTEEETIEN
jgi:hypothetical protein